MDANKAFQIIEKAFSDKRLVLVTDGTVTRRVVSVGLAEKLYIHTEAGAARLIPTTSAISRSV